MRGTGTHSDALTNLDIAGDLIMMMRSSVLMLITAGVCVSQINVNTDVDHISLGLKPMPCTSVDLHIYGRKLGTIIIQTLCILQHDSADTGSLAKRNL